MEKLLKEIKEMAITKANELDLTIVSVDWVEEFGTHVLRIIADSYDGLTIDESTSLNESISDELDRLDLIKEEYMLEVSSPGVERELTSLDEVKSNINEYVHIDFINSFNINKKTTVKELDGTLVDVINDTTLVVNYNNHGQIKNLEINYDEIKLIRLAIKF